MYPVIKTWGEGNSEKRLNMLKHFLNLILTFEAYLIKTEKRICTTVCDNCWLIYSWTE